MLVPVTEKNHVYGPHLRTSNFLSQNYGRRFKSEATSIKGFVEGKTKLAGSESFLSPKDNTVVEAALEDRGVIGLLPSDLVPRGHVEEELGRDNIEPTYSRLCTFISEPITL